MKLAGKKAGAKRNFIFQKGIDPHVTLFLIIGTSFKIKGILKEIVNGLYS